VVLSAVAIGRAAEKGRAQPALRVGLVASLFQDLPRASSSRSALALSALPIDRLVQDQTGIRARVSVAQDHDQLGRLLAEGKVDLGLFHGVEFAWARQKYPTLRPMLILVNERPTLRACLIVRRGSTATEFADLKGRSCALAGGCRQHCRLYLESRCREGGAEPRDCFSRLVTPACVGDAIEAVADGDVDATVVDEVAIDCFREQKPGRFARLQVIQRSEVFPAAVLAYAEGALDRSRLRQVRDSLMQAGRSPRARISLTLCRLTGFARVPEDYDQTLRGIAVAYQPPAKASILDWLLAGPAGSQPRSAKAGASTPSTETLNGR
jgi:ABC-type phosphate/phosphonate transport system substrate-binding protein